MDSVLLRETASVLTFIMNVISVNFTACFQIICWFLQTLNYRGNKKYVLVLDKSFLCLTLVFDSCKTKQIYLVRDHRIMTLDSNQNLIFNNCLYFDQKTWRWRIVMTTRHWWNSTRQSRCMLGKIASLSFRISMITIFLSD